MLLSSTILQLAARGGRQHAAHALEAVALDEEEDARALVALQNQACGVEVVAARPRPTCRRARLRVDLVARVEVLAAPVEVPDDERLFGAAAVGVVGGDDVLLAPVRAEVGHVAVGEEGAVEHGDDGDRPDARRGAPSRATRPSAASMKRGRHQPQPGGRRRRRALGRRAGGDGDDQRDDEARRRAATTRPRAGAGASSARRVDAAAARGDDDRARATASGRAAPSTSRRRAVLVAVAVDRRRRPGAPRAGHEHVVVVEHPQKARRIGGQIARAGER